MALNTVRDELKNLRFIYTTACVIGSILFLIAVFIPHSYFFSTHVNEKLGYFIPISLIFTFSNVYVAHLFFEFRLRKVDLIDELLEKMKEFRNSMFLFMIILLPQILFNTIVAAFTFNAFYILVNVLPLYFVFKTVPSVTKVVEWLSLDEWEEKEMRMKLS